MPRTFDTATIGRPVNVVFNYVTSAANWPKWYPITKSVSGVIDRPGNAGEGFVEKVSILGMPFTFYWTTTANEFPHRYVFEGTSNAGGKAVITYTFADKGTATAFTRELVYEQTNFIMKILNVLFIARVVSKVSTEAVQNLKAAIEAT